MSPRLASGCAVVSPHRPGAATLTVVTALVLLVGVLAAAATAQDWRLPDVAASALPPNEAFIWDPESGQPNLDGAGGFAIPGAELDRGVDVRADGPPVVTRVRIFGSVAQGKYGRGERISVRVSFDQPLVVSGAPRLALTIGDEIRLADLSQSFYGWVALDFTYEVQGTDVDADGIGIAGDALRLNGGTIRNAAGIDANLGLGGQEVEDHPDFKIDGRVDNPPIYMGWQSKAPDDGDTYGRGERINIWINFSERVVVNGAPRLALTVGSRTRFASFHRVATSDLTSGSTLRFVYDIQASDHDPDGIGIAGDALRLNGATIRDIRGANVNLDLGDGLSIGRPVDGRIDRPPAVYHAYASCTADRISVSVSLNRLVAVTGAPRLALAIGSQVRLATLDGVSWNHLWGTTALAFTYVVQTSDRDPDGVSVPADAVRLDGGTIRDASGDEADLDLGSRAITNDARCTVDDQPAGAPTVERLSLSVPQNRETYLRGEAIEGFVAFDQPVTVTGTPQLMLSFGSQVRPAAFYHLTEPAATTLRFAYTVDAADRALDGVSIAANALRLNGGSIRSIQGGLPAMLDHSSLPAVVLRKAAGDRADTLPPTVRLARVLSWPRTPGGYRVGETIRVDVLFNEYVVVDALELTIGSRTRVAHAVDPGSRFGRWFEYVVDASDVDFDGMSVAPDALKLGGGVLTDTHGNRAPLGLGHRAIGDDFAHRVNAPVLSRVPTPGGSMTTFQVTELRRRIDAARARCGISSVRWTDPDIEPGVTPVKAVHVTLARTALAAAYQACGRTPPAWTDPGLAPGTSIKAMHFTELRNAADALQ